MQQSLSWEANKQQSLSWEANSCSAKQEIPHNVWNLKDHHHVQEEPHLVSVLGQMTLPNILQTYFWDLF
jgi:hypothetical protein